jgi:tRNA-Thr(GGU) m(6)t(6)A37 methyltransferase TsaA
MSWSFPYWRGNRIANQQAAELEIEEMSVKGKVDFIGTVVKASEQEAEVHVFPEFCAGLKEITGFSHLIILYWMHLRDHKKERHVLLVFPRKHAVDIETGVFACRSPSRPNPIGLCVVQLMKIEKCVLTVKGLDAVEGSPIVDIKPYLPRADCVSDARGPEWTRHGPTT